MALRLWDWLERLGVRILGWVGLPTQTARQLMRFFKVGGFAAIAYVAAMAAVVDGFGCRVLLVERAGVHYLLVSLTVLIVIPMFNFAGHRLITFARPG
jgi:putative flippase GtrA